MSVRMMLFCLLQILLTILGYLPGIIHALYLIVSSQPNDFLDRRMQAIRTVPYAYVQHHHLLHQCATHYYAS